MHSFAIRVADKPGTRPMSGRPKTGPRKGRDADGKIGVIVTDYEQNHG